MGRFLQLLGLVIGVAALVLQFSITIPASIAAGRGFFGSIVFYFSFFTILTNIAAVLVHVSLLSPAGYAWLPGFAGPRMRAGVAVAITVVFLVYVAVLAPLWRPQGLALLCDVLLHYVTPALFVLWWLAAGADGSLRWGDIPAWLACTVLYVIYALARAPFAGEVPYPFLDIGRNGTLSVALSSAAIAALFVVLGALAVFIDRSLPRHRNAARRR